MLTRTIGRVLGLYDLDLSAFPRRGEETKPLPQDQTILKYASK